jgi:putative ABC transport system permease protein
MVEAMTLAATSRLVGSFAIYIFFDGMDASTLGGRFTQVVFSFQLSSYLFVQGITLALVIGFISGVFNA